jgi:hypothetical protein
VTPTTVKDVVAVAPRNATGLSTCFTTPYALRRVRTALLPVELQRSAHLLLAAWHYKIGHFRTTWCSEAVHKALKEEICKSKVLKLVILSLRFLLLFLEFDHSKALQLADDDCDWCLLHVLTAT